MKIKSLLLPDEIDYCEKIVSYVKNNILNLVQKADLIRYGIKLCKRPILYNSLEVDSYHRFIASDKCSSNSEEYKKWHHITNAPFLLEKNNSEENPLIITEISAVNAFVLDYLCYATISLPTEDLTRVLSCPVNGKTVKDTIIEVFGVDAFDYIMKAVDDLNGEKFRRFVYSGLLIE